MATGKEALEKLAELAAQKTKLNVAFSSQKDQAFSMRVAAVHPLQVLENVHQEQVRKAIAELKNPSPDEEQKAEQEQLAKYFLFTPSEPKLVNLKKGEEETTIETELAEVAKALKLVKAVLNAGPEDEEAKKLAQARDTLEEARTKLVEVRKEFKDDDDKVGWLEDAKKILEGEDKDKKTLETRISEADTWDKIKAEHAPLDKALDALEEAAAGLSRITMLYAISPFFLFRLLVQYRIEGKDIDDQNRRDVSSEVTGDLNKQDWIRDWLAKQMEVINGKISGHKPKVFFHLKGGRALALLLGTEGENDWDTSIVIDPTLPNDKWYKLYNEIHDDVLKVLRTAKQEFLVLASEKAGDLTTYCTKELEKIVKKDDKDDDLDDFSQVQKQSAKAEMIDIGIPRRDTIEALEQWHHTKDSILIAEKYGAKIPIPGPLYYIEEYVVMVREALSNRSPSLHKTAKRIQRMADVLDPKKAKKIDETIDDVKKKIPSKLKKSLELVGDKEGRVGRVMTLLLQEFSVGYRLHELAGLAIVFDRTFTKEGKTPDHDKIPDEVEAGKRKFLRDKKGKEDPEKVKRWNDSKCDDILKHIAFAQTLSIKLEKHLRTRAEYFGFRSKSEEAGMIRRKYLGQLVKALYTASVFRQEERLEVQLAVAGSHAAYLHADYSRDFNNRIDVLDPVTMIDLRYYCHKEDADPATVLDVFVKQPLRDYIDQGEIAFTRDDIVGMKLGEKAKDDKITGEVIYLTWPKEVDFGDGFKYKPVILKISVKKQWPEISFVWGYPVLSLKDLIRDYVEAAALAGEFETKYRLRDTSEILKEMMTRYI